MSFCENMHNSHDKIQEKIGFFSTIMIVRIKNNYMKQRDLKYSCLIAVLYFGMNVNAQTTPNDTVSKEQKIEEVVMIGYGTAKKRDLTGSIAKVSGSDVADKPNANAAASLQGKVAGLAVVNSGQPGATPDIRIRGTVSRYNSRPLYVVDGIWTDNMDFVNSNDIESIEVLKDASSLAIFGVRGANGVIIVTTKRAKSGKPTITFSSSLGTKFLTGKPELTNASEFKSLYDRNRANQGLAPYSYYDIFNSDTDWIDAITNNGATIIKNDLSFSSSTEKSKTYFGIGHLEEQGIINNELLKRFNVNFNNEFNFTKNFKVGFSINGSFTNNPRLQNYSSALVAVPIVAPFNDDLGLYNQLPIGLGDAQVGNPLLSVDYLSGTQLSKTYRILANAFAEVKFWNDFTLRTNYMVDLGMTRARGYNPVAKLYVGETNSTTNAFGGRQLTSVYQNTTDNIITQQEYLLTWNKNLSGHNITATAGYTIYDEKFEQMSGNVTQKAGEQNAIPWNRRFWYLDTYPFGDPASRTATSSEYDDGASISYLARVLYNYKGKYIFNASFRRDGSATFAADNPNQYQNFWALGAAWDLGKESFMDDSFFSSLKLKGSYGQLGNRFSPYRYPNYPGYVGGATAVFADVAFQKDLYPGYILAWQNSPNLKWEVITSYEAGFEASAFNNRLSVEAVYYNKRTKDLLNYVTGVQNYFRNSGEIENKGIEGSIAWRDKIGEDFNYSIGGNITTYDNKVLSVFEPGYRIFDGNSVTEAGFPIGYFYGYEVEGVYQTNADVLLSPTSTLGTYGPGDLKFKDLNGDGKIDDQDRTIIGNPTPDFTYALNLNLNYKNWSLGIDLQGVYGNEILRNWGNGSTFAQFNYRKARLDAWNGEGTSNWEPIINDGNNYNTNNVSNYMIEDGSYVRLRNIQLGYNFNSNTAKSIGLSSLRIYLNAQNLVTWRNNSGFTPEAGGTPTQFGVDNGGYPLPIITTMGVNVTF